MAFTVDSALSFLGYDDNVKDEIHTLYSEPHRRYHNLDHLNAMLRWVDPEYKNVRHLLDAILFHDLVYPSMPCPVGWAESCSLALFSIRKFASMHGDDVSGILIPVQAINATAYHLKDQEHLAEVSQFLLDLDLQSFSRPEEEYLKDDENVHAELRLIYNDEQKILAGRVAFLKNLLARKRLYYILTHWEKPARENIAKRLAAFENLLAA